MALQALAMTRPFMALQEYLALYRRLYAADEDGALRLSAWLHDLGVVLHFQDDELLREIIILQNGWGTDAVFKVLDDVEVVKHHGRFSIADCNRIWDGPKYQGKQKELRQLMLKFELSYELRDTAPQKWLATQLLPQTPPEHGFGDKPDDLFLRYTYEVMPKGLVARLMVRMNRYVLDPELAWRQGVVFAHRDRDAQALVHIPYGKKEIHLRARGAGKQILMALISEDLETLNDTFEGLKDKVTKLVPCICGACKGSSAPYMFDAATLLEMREYKIANVRCGNRPFGEVEVADLLEETGYKEMAIETKERRGDAAMKTVRIFLASSQEMEFERKEFEIFINRENKRYVQEGIFLQLEVWEDFIDAMSKTRLQDEYNKVVQQCDIFLSMFFTKVGKYTEEEFGVALEAFTQKGKPYVYTYFKDAAVNTGSMKEADLLSMIQFKKRLWDLGHYHTAFTSVEDLKFRFSQQLEKLLPGFRGSGMRGS
jgi:internalin A